MNRTLLYSLSIIIGLFVSSTGIFGLIPDHLAEWPVNIWCIGLFCFIFAKTNKKERIEMLTVLAFATPMELFFSEVWLIYEYQRDLMPLYVPVGHWFLFDLGRIWSEKLSEKHSFNLVLLLTPLVLYGLVTGTDTSAVLLLVFCLIFIKFGPMPSLYATMVYFALIMEIWGTYLGAWEWAREVPWTPFTAWNPPLLVGAFYCLGDLLVNLAVERFDTSDEKLESIENLQGLNNTV